MASQFMLMHKIRQNGGLEIRTKFGRQKALSMIEHNDQYYNNIYDNRILDGIQSTDRLNLTLPELEELVKLRTSLEMKRDCFQEVCGSYSLEPSQ